MLTSLPFLFAVSGASQVLQGGLAFSEGTTNAWNKQWDTVFQSTLYTSINHIAITFAVGSLLFFIVQMFRNMVAFDEINEHLADLAWPLIVIFMLANNSYMTANATFAMREMIKTVSTEVLSTTLLEVRLQDAVQNAFLRGAIGGEITAQLNQCEGLVGEPQVSCLVIANEQVQKTIDDFAARTGIPGSFVKMRAAISSAINAIPVVRGAGGAVENAGDADNPLAAIPAAVTGFFGGYLSATIQTVVQVVLLAFQWAFANVLEISMLLTGLMGPLAVAGSLLPFGPKSIFTWIIGFFSLGMAQISYNIIVGMCAVVIVNADITDVNGFLVIVGLLGPALALAIATGGGISVFNVITSGTVELAKTTARTGAMGAF